MNFKALSLFSGCGGFCEGVETAGFQVASAVELDKYAAETYRYNFPKVRLFEGSVCDFLNTPEEDTKKYGLEGVDMVFGGPPCQGFSQIGPRNLDDERNTLYLEFVRIVRILRPKIILMENVPNLLLLNKGHFRKLICRDFAKIGYGNVTPIKVVASDYGVPQDRIRVFFVGTRDDLRFDQDISAFVENELAKYRVIKPFTVADAISDLPDDVVHSGETLSYPPACDHLSQFQKMMRLDFSAGPYTKSIKKNRGIKKAGAMLHNHHTKEMQERRRHLISFLQPGAKADSLPKEIWNGKRPEKWRRLHPDFPSYTILAQMHRDLSEWVHPRLERWITVREAARLQSFHDGFVFVGSEWQQLKQIGNAVPPLLGYAISSAARAVLARIQTMQMGASEMEQSHNQSGQALLPLSL